MENTQVKLDGFPVPLAWMLPPASWSVTEGGLTVAAGPGTDLFIDPADGNQTLTAPCLLGAVEGDFQLSARVRVGFTATYDAGVLVALVDGQTWGKLCFEQSPQGRPMIVSVVTRGVSDDANAFTVDGDSVWLRISRIATTYAFHASIDGSWWHLIRHFRLDGRPGPVSVGFETQSPMGDGCTAVFDQIRHVGRRLAELRDGS